MTRQSSSSYSSVEELLEDIDLAVSDITEKLQLAKDGDQFVPVSPSQAETSVRITAFKKRAHELVAREKKGKTTLPNDSVATNLAAHVANGAIGVSSLAGVNASSRENKVVLTLYGNAPQPKQLFSSLQLPARINGETKDIVQTLREAGLPNGITTTQIVPIQSTGLTEDRKRMPTMGDLFPTPSTVPQLQPPKKSSKIASTRSSTVGWYQPATADPHPRNGSYFKQSVSTGQWLDYSNAAPSPGIKRRQRDRALSLGGSKAPQLEVDPTELESAKLEALFQSAYSSFAPTKDDAAAIVPSGMVGRIWWEHIGEKSFDRFMQNANNLVELTVPKPDTTDQAVANVVEVDDDDEVEQFREAVDSFERAIDPNSESVAWKAANEKDVDEVLEDISDLLRTLNSHQRNRHLNLNQSGRPGGLLKALDTSSLGTPSKPSEPEISIYEILKSQLTLMIATLPPYAVAKLDSDQLAELAINTKMEISMDDYKGVMEEDEASVRARASPFGAASASRPVPQPQQRPSSSSLYGNQYSAPRAAVPPQYYGQTQTTIRPPSSNLQRLPATAQVPYPSQRPAPSGAYRPNAYGNPNYQSRPQQPYTPQPQYQANPSHHNYNRPSGQPYQAAPQSAPPAAMNPRYVGQPSYSQPVPAQNGMNYQYDNGVNAARQGSPQKPMPSPQPTYNQTQAGPPYATPTTSTMPDRRPYLQNPMAQPQMMNGGSTPLHHQPQHAPQQQQLGPTNYSTFMTTEQQSSMMERQRAQLAQQQGLQQMARNAAQAGAMGSPSNSQVNGNALSAGL